MASMTTPPVAGCSSQIKPTHRQAGIALDPVTRRVDGPRIGRMQGEGMARNRRAVRRAVVREQAVEADQGAGRGFDQDGRAVVWPGCGCRAFSSKNSGENIAVDLLPLTP